MSGFYYYEALHPSTKRSIQAGADTANALNAKACGCHERSDKWWLCSYHEGYEDGTSACD